ncbi:hypothetical protein [Bradyrhizobium sp.]|jgi:hypothetical protein|uniref:hypothetical protein n=1 Tax=Bradyrhizobium sp. TaxID=376 RepID=UPI003C3590E3
MGVVVLLAMIVVVLVWVGLVMALAPRQGRHNLQQHFPATVEPGGPFVQSNVLFVPDESHTPCIAKATPAGLYLASPEKAFAMRIWGVTGPSYLTKPVLIPWSALKYGLAKFPLWGWVRFDVASAKVTFFVRRKVAAELLQTAGQPLPWVSPAG